ncbi:MAG: phytanoyl-CoA dioxygenase family protein [Gemmatimonadetes bacterium]|jgi:phytanoyl-CoA hydroxylase|nr:phytanoyl-CoA dioxygenase family protein [Gemmatimonadota bacterium]MBT7419992.1 phytanoyl-CoA dioxygenase family protein [Gemmatimonadota bacterium]
MNPQQQRRFFEERGYLIVPDLLDDDEIAASRAEIKRLHQLATDLHTREDPLRGHFQREPFAHNHNRGDLPILRKIENTRNFSDFFARLSAHPNLVSTIQNLLGNDLLLFRSTLMLKPALHGSAHALHQDSAYWPMEPPALATASIALDDATSQNGCIKVIPRSHHWGLQQWGHIAQAQDAPLSDREDLDLSGQIDVELKAGSAVLFHSLMVHGSGPNQTEHSRNTALYAYFSPHVRYVPGKGAPREKSFPVIAGLNDATEHTLVAS